MHIARIVNVGLRLLDTKTIPFDLEGSDGKQLTEFIDHYQSCGADERRIISELIECVDARRLIGYAIYMANCAVRRKSLQDVERGLIACVLEGVRSDFRDTTAALSLLYHSTTKLGGNAEVLFTEAARCGDKRAGEFLLNYLARGEKRIEAMGFVEGVDLNGAFKYLVEPRPSRIRNPRTGQN